MDAGARGKLSAMSDELNGEGMKLAFESASISVPGRVRDYNEDAVLDRAEAALWVVADGMGGHAAGDVASNLIVEELGKLASSGRLAHMVDQVEQTVLSVNRELRRRSRESGDKIMGSTVVFLVGLDGHMVCGWAGDSRAYRIRQGTLEQINRDHSHVAELVERGEITEEEALVHPDANVVTRAVGGEPRLVLEYSICDQQAGDRYLLCSDGVDKEVMHKHLEELMAADNDAASCAQAVVDAALEAGGRDNISVIIIDLKEPGSE